MLVVAVVVLEKTPLLAALAVQVVAAKVVALQLARQLLDRQILVVVVVAQTSTVALLKLVVQVSWQFVMQTLTQQQPLRQAPPQ
jgi:hypothetical protein